MNIIVKINMLAVSRVLKCRDVFVFNGFFFFFYFLFVRNVSSSIVNESMCYKRKRDIVTDNCKFHYLCD